MSTATSDRNLLFGILAVQMDFVTETDLIAAMNSWLLEKSLPLDQHLLQSKALSKETHQLLDALVTKHIEQHGGQAQQSLAALSAVGGIRDQLAKIADPNIQATLHHLPRASTAGNDEFATQLGAQPNPEDLEDRFTVLRPHAAGGLGQVSVAKDTELNREVALKELLDRHADDFNSRARFLLEAEITGGLEHPGVVPIYALGRYADGRPYYAMRFIRGDSLRQAAERFHREASGDWTRAADQLQLRRLLSRVIDVCNAIEYAHSRGVLHRDLKPDNIMLGQYGETLVVDWGLAKAMGQATENSAIDDLAGPVLSEAALNPMSGSGSAPTQMGSAVGTPAFMSPEQAAGRLNELGPASDVYSLGATLYAVLTGQAPQTDTDLGEVLTRVQRGAFPPPREVKKTVPRGLQAICLKAMETKPGDRYVSARQLGEDLEAWLGDEPVIALPETVFSRGRRWVKKHRSLVTSAVAALLVGLAVSAFAVVTLSAANRREQRAKESAVTEKEKAEAAEDETSKQKERADDLLNVAEKALVHFEELSKSEQLLTHGMESLRSDLLENMVEYYAALAKIGGKTEEERAGRANAYSRLGGTYQVLGKSEKAIAAFQQSVELFQDLYQQAEPSPTAATTNDVQASSQQYSETDATNVKGVPLEKEVAWVRLTKRQYQEYLAQLEAEIGLLESYDHRPREATQHNQTAQQYYEDLLAWQEETGTSEHTRFQRGLAYVLQNDAERERKLGRMAQSDEKLDQAIKILKGIDLTKYANSGEAEQVQFSLAAIYSQRGALQAGALWQFEAAQNSYDQSAGLLAELRQKYPENGQVGYKLALNYSNLAALLQSKNLFDKTALTVEKGLEVLGQIEQLYPDVPDYRRLTADLKYMLGYTCQYTTGGSRNNEVVPLIESAIEIISEQVRQHPNQTAPRLSLANYASNLGVIQAAQGDAEESDASFQLALDTVNDTLKRGTPTIDQLIGIGNTQLLIANALNDCGESQRALEVLERAENNAQSIIKMAPKMGSGHLFLGQVYLSQAIASMEQGEYVQAFRKCDEVGEISKTLTQVSDNQQMQSGFKTINASAKAMRVAGIITTRNDSLDDLLERGYYALAADQASRFAAYTQEPQDLLLALRIATEAADAARADENFTTEQQAEQDALVDKLQVAAVDHLRAAWQAGQMRRKSSFASLLSSGPTLKTLRSDALYESLRKRHDFQDLLDQIEENPNPKTEE